MAKNRLIFLLVLLLIFTGCGRRTSAPSARALPKSAEEIPGLTFLSRAEPSYAEQFVIDRYRDGYSMIHIADGQRYLVVPEGGQIPEGLDPEIKVIRRPLGGVYMAATAVMSFFDALGGTGAVRFSSVESDGWYIDGAKKAMERGGMVYAGKYSLPDYELLLSEGCGLSIQSTMIGHAPEVKEKLEELGITVFVDRSSYESHPLGRSEWVKVYGELLGEGELAETLFEEQAAHLEALPKPEGEKKKVVCFYISGGGKIVTRKSGDYVSRMIELAGGENILSEPGEDNALSTVTMEPEEFFAKAGDADIIIYDGAVGGQLGSLEELKEKSSLLEDFKAVKNGDVWCTGKSFFQETLSLGEVISEFGSIFSGTAQDELTHLYRLKGGDAS